MKTIDELIQEIRLLNIGTTTLGWADKDSFKIINLKKVKPELYKKLEGFVEAVEEEK